MSNASESHFGSKRLTVNRLLALLAGVVLLVSVSSVPIATVSAVSTMANTIPPQVVVYTEQHSGTYGCISGTLDPFTIESVTCPNLNDTVVNGLSASSSVQPRSMRVAPLSTYSITCSGVCLSGTDDSAYYYYGLWDAFLNPVPSNPSTLYTTGVGGYPYVSEWMGLSTCVPSCSGYVVQGGVSYGSDGSSDSHHPGIWVEYLAPSGTCSSTFCGNYMSSGSGDNDNWEMYYLSSSSQWLLYAQDTTVSHFITYYIPVGGSGNMPYTTLQYGLIADEGHGVNGASYWPGSATFTYVVGEDSSGTFQLGTQGPNFAVPSGTSLTSSITYSTTTCYAGTCASVGLHVT